MRLRNHLHLVVLAGLLPLVLFALVTGYLLVDEQRTTFRRGAEERSLAMLSAVDAQLNRAVDAIQVLSKAESLNAGNLVAFRRNAERVLATQSDWNTISVALPSGERLMDLVVPEGEPFPQVPRVENSFERVLEARAPVIGNLTEGLSSASWNYAVRTVVMEGDAIRYVLTAVVRPEAVARLVLAQNLPEGWVGVVLDASNRMVARTVDAEESAGQLPSASLRDALTRSPNGWFRWVTDGGVDIYTAYHRSELTGWTFAMGVPASAVAASTGRAVVLFGAGLLSALVLALLLARVVGRRIAEPIAALAAQTEGVQRGERVAIPQDIAVSEIEAFANTLQHTLATLREREERLKLAVDAGGMGIWEWNLRGDEIHWSAEMDAMHGIVPGPHTGKRAGGYQQLLHPDDRGLVEQAIARGLQQGEHQVEYRIVRPDGGLRWLEGRGKVLRDDSGAPQRMIGLCVDITERKLVEQALQESETRFRNMADTAPAILWVTDPDGRLVFLSRGWFEFTGQTHEQAFSKDGFGWLDAVHQDDAGRAGDAFRAANAARADFAFDYRLLRADGVYRWAMDAGKPRVDAQGNYLGLVGAVIDIDDRKRVEDELHASTQALREADRHKDEFLATLSHELRNPLAALTTAAHVLRVGESVDEKTAAVHGVIERQTQHMVRLIEDLLDMTRVRLGKISLHRQAVNLADLVADVTQTRRLAGAFGGRANVVLDTTPAWVHGDTSRLEQIYSNLLDNALKFTPATGTVRISVRSEGACALLVVSDDGSGIAPQILPRVFELFVQGEHAPRRTRGGLGLGLALVRQLAELHGGTVSAESAGEGRGARFTVSLPAIAPPALTGVNTVNGPAVRQGGLKVLLVEDNEDVRLMTRTHLELAGHQVFEAAGGLDALAQAGTLNPDAILLDIGLPDIEGYEVATRLRASAGGNSLVLIALSGHGEDYRRAREAGFDAHVVKPADIDKVMDMMMELVNRKPG